MKKKLLFVIPGLDAGGAEKSLVNLLSAMDESRFSVDLFMFSHEGLFMGQIPNWVRVIPKNAELANFQKPLFYSLLTFLKKGKLSAAKDRLFFYVKNKFIKNPGIAEQYAWKHLRSACETPTEHYDVAIGFLEKTSNYFVVDCVAAKAKIAFIHTTYSELNMDVSFDLKYFDVTKNIAVVSPDCAANFKKVFPEFADKVYVMPNIVSPRLINKLAQESPEDVYETSLVSVGRLESVKGFDMAIEAARILNEQNIAFHWSIIGEGTERGNLQNLIDRYDLQNHFTLIGLKDNPYPYIRTAKIFVQSSRYEGKSIAVDEAKILAKPIILTNFTTAKDQIENNVNGLIVGMTPDAIAAGIIKYLEDASFTEHIIANLRADYFGTEHEIEKFYQLINE
ncbi:glycosyltransferase [Chryseobacterium gotjawalense]|uniref:Glycosyltransferase n=1 Tax=Chryseobacterium gotjawalense TaxID=3042315 RepID=A0ABY8RBU1_9FLAO|nr:glycosyltransferase [Chryseobacterium sp. wdc7]WHF51430.1 glycosyltransferase [Chryseobacterium sp. wdc7]